VVQVPQPYVILDSGMSLNGRFIKDKQHRNRLNEYRKQELRGRVDAIMVSSQTIIEDNPEYPVKSSIKKEPALVIIDKNCETPPKAAVLKDKKKRITMVVSKSASPSRINALQHVREDIEVLTLGEHAVNIENTLWELNKKGVNRILVEGNPALNTRMLRERWVNEIYVIVYPVILDSKENAFKERVEGDKTLNLDGIMQYGDHVVLHYIVR
jgi:riboflavin-specific deaminase-like protein